MKVAEHAQWLQEESIHQALAQEETAPRERVLDILVKARELQGLNLHEVAALSTVTDTALLISGSSSLDRWCFFAASLST